MLLILVIRIRTQVEEELPLKQGLKPWIGKHIQRDLDIVEEELPLKQGLKLTCNSYDRSDEYVEEELPLKQGLKHP